MKATTNPNDPKDLRRAIMEMRSVAMTLVTWADRLEKSLAKEEGDASAVSAAGNASSAREVSAAEDVSAVEGVSSAGDDSSAGCVSEKQLTLADVQGPLADMCADGLSDAVRNLIRSFGVRKLSEVNPKQYATLLEVARRLKEKGAK